MHNRDNWDDLRFVLEVVRAGSVSAAGKTLGVNHATVLRRVAAFEARFGVTLFDKTVRGYAVAPGNQQVLEALTAAEEAFQAVDRAAKGARVPLRGNVRVTSTDTLCVAVLPEILAEIAQEAPELRIELISSNLHLNLSRMDADLTVRPAHELPDELEGEAPARLGFSAYRAVGYDGGDWLDLAGPLSRSAAGAWMKAYADPDAIRAGSDSFLTLREMAAAGLGAAALPSFLGDADPRLELVQGPSRAPSVPIWVAGHKDLAHLERLVAIRRLIAAGLALRKDRLLGRQNH